MGARGGDEMASISKVPASGEIRIGSSDRAGTASYKGRRFASASSCVLGV